MKTSIILHDTHLKHLAKAAWTKFMYFLFFAICTTTLTSQAQISGNLLYEQTFDSANVWSLPIDTLWSWTPNGKAEGGQYWADRERIQSESLGGALVFNADALLDAGSMAPSEGALLGASITLCDNCVAEDDTVMITYWQYYRAFEDSVVIEAINFATGAFETIKTMRLNRNVETSTKDREVISLSSDYVKGGSSIQIRFRAINLSYFFILDDFKVWKNKALSLTEPSRIGDHLSTHGLDYVVTDSNGIAIPGEIVVRFLPERDSTTKDSVRTAYGIDRYRVCPCDPDTELWILGGDGGDSLGSGGITIDIDESVGSMSQSSDLDEVDPNYYSENLFQSPSVNRPIVAALDSVPSGIMPPDNGDVVIGVLDSGIDYTHPTLRPYIWKNPNPSSTGFGGQDSIGWNFVNDLNRSDNIIGSNNPMDRQTHGSHVAGIIVDYLKNKAGVEDFKILPVKTHDSLGVASLFNLVCGMHYAIKRGAKVINGSWGWKHVQSGSFNRALEVARENNVVFVTATGNDTLLLDDLKQYPACLTPPSPNNHMLSVTSVKKLPSDFNVYELSDFSNKSNNYVSIGALGDNIMSTLPLWKQASNNMGPKSGTSMAAPAVAAAAAKLCLNNPSMSAEDIVRTILTNAYQESDLNGDIINGHILDFDSVCQIVSITPSILQQKAFEAYPNPFRDAISIYVTQDITSAGEIQLLDAFGKEIHHIPFQYLAEGTKVEIHQSLASGLYLLRLKSKEIIWIQKLVKY